MIKQMNDLTINKLKKISQENYKILCDCAKALERIAEEKLATHLENLVVDKINKL